MSLTKQKYANSLNELFRAGKLKDLINFPPSFQELGADGHRILLNYQGMAFAALGAPLKAKMTYEKALNYGENIQLLRDLACTYYQLEEFQSWRDSYIKLKEVLKAQSQHLEFDARFSCSIVLAKFLEEEGRLGQALNIYEELYKQSKCNDKNSKQFYLLAPQLLRLKSQLPASEELSHLYTQLLSYDQNSQSDYINVEIEHSLMLAELSLIGTQHGWTRVEKILTDKKAMIHDKRLFYIDFLEETILHNQESNEQYINPGTDIIKDFSKYEECVFNLLNKQNENAVINLNTVAREVPLGSYLKLLNLYAVKTSDENIKNEYKNKISLIIAGFDSSDRAFWIKRTQQFSRDNYTELFLNIEKRVLNFHSKLMDVSRKKQSLLLLKLLADKSSWNIDDAIHSIWNTSYSPEHFNRLRMSVHRTNQLLFELTTKEKCIEISGEHLNLHPSIKLIPEGMLFDK